MKKSHRSNIVIVLFCTLVLLLVQGCNKTPKVNEDNNEVNSLLFFITRIEHGGEVDINEFKRFDRDKDTIFYYIKWNYKTGENITEREHLIVFSSPSLKSDLYPLNYLNDYPSIQDAWNELNEKNYFKSFSKVEIEQLLVNVNKLRKGLETQ